MEFFQTIWTALTTPNEGLFKIITLPLNFLDAYVCMVFFTTLLNIDASKKQKAIYVVTFSIFAILINAILPNIYATFASMILWPILVITILKAPILKGILSEVITYALTACFDYLITKFFFIVFNIGYDALIAVPLYRIAAMCSIYFMIWLFGMVIKYFKINIEIFDNMQKNTKILLIANSLLIVLVIATQFYLINFYSDITPSFITFISILGLMAYFGVSIYSIINTSKLEIASRDLEGAQLQIKSLGILHDTMRAFKHDFGNIVHGMSGYIDKKDFNGLKKYYSQLLADCGRANNLTALNPNVVNHPAIYNILATKYYKADELGIDINLDLFLNLNEIEKNMKIYEFTRILRNFDG